MERFILVEIKEAKGYIFSCIALESNIVISNKTVSIEEYNENKTQHVFNRYFVYSMHFTPYTDFKSAYLSLLSLDPRNRIK